MYGFEKYGDFTKLFRPSPSRANPVIGESVPTPPLVGCTQTFITFTCQSEEECINVDKYINTKFCKALLSILKVTQHNPPRTWKYVPLQDFSNNSDIDWSGSLAEIDKQLYRKYDLDNSTIEFIESHFCYHPRFDEKAAFIKKYGVNDFYKHYKAELAARRCTEDV